MAGRVVSGDDLRRALGDNRPAALPTFGSQVDDPVGGGDDVEVVLDDDHRVAARDEPVDDAEQAVDVGRRGVTARLIVSDQCRSWARRRRVPLHDLLQRFVDLGASVCELLPPSHTGLPTVSSMLAAAAVPADAAGSLAGSPDASMPPPHELDNVRLTHDLEGAPLLAARLRTYAAACGAVHPHLKLADHEFLVAGYAVSLAVPADAAVAVARLAVALVRTPHEQSTGASDR